MSKIFSIIVNTVDILSQKNFFFENLKYLINNFIIKIKLNFYDKSRPTNLDK